MTNEEKNLKIGLSIHGPFDHQKYCGRCGWTLRADGCTSELCLFVVKLPSGRADERVIPYDTDETASASLLERMPEPEMRKYAKSGNDPEAWVCRADVFGPCSAKNPDRKTAIRDAYFAMIALAWDAKKE